MGGDEETGFRDEGKELWDRCQELYGISWAGYGQGFHCSGNFWGSTRVNLLKNPVN